MSDPTLFKGPVVSPEEGRALVAKIKKEYISLSLGNLRFIDSNAFLLTSLDMLVESTPKDALKITKKVVD